MPRLLARLLVLCAAVCPGGVTLVAAELRGIVNFAGLPVPGATVTATSADKTFVALSDPGGIYTFADLADGVWSFRVEMLCFATLQQDVTVAAGSPGPVWDLKLLPMAEIQAAAGPAAPLSQAAPVQAIPALKTARGKKAAAAVPPQPGFQRADLNAPASASGSAPPARGAPASEAFANQSADELSQKATDGLLINGSSNNGASSPFALSNAFGNSRRGGRSLYNGGLAFIFDNSALDARPWSVTGQETAKQAYTHLQGVASLGGPLKIPHLLRNGPVVFVGYQWLHRRTATIQSGLVPTAAERLGDLSGVTIPVSLISPQAKALLGYYPLPNFTGSNSFNYQTALLGLTDQDSIQARASKALGNRNQVTGSFALQHSATESPNLFGFVDNTSTLGLNSGVGWNHRFNQRVFVRFNYQFSRASTSITPWFAGVRNVSGEAGIAGNNQDPENWGPPALSFSNGIAGLSDAQYSVTHNQTSAFSFDGFWNRSPHNFSYGADFRRLQFNSLSQQDPRGQFTFTGVVSGSAFGDFLLGSPAASSLAFGNADKYFRSSSWDGFVNDDWRVGPGLTINAGLRWEYSSPITELFDRLVNLDVTPGFASATPVIAGNGKYPDSLVRPDKTGFQPRLAFSWRPFPASSMVVRGGYGVYYNTSVYQTIATQMAQQPPLSKSFSLSNTQAPLSLANGFNTPVSTNRNTFGIDPDFRVGYTHNWQLSVQRDLRGGMVMTATYLGIKGTRAVQEFLPNTYPAGVVNPCPLCASGYAYMTSNGNSTREAGQLQVRRRLHNGFTASVDYTYSKSIDDAALGGKGQGTAVIAQNWLNLSAERGLSNFDQRHLVSFLAQYTTGMGIGGGTLLNGWKGAAFKEWTFLTQITAGTGLPLTPVILDPVPGTGVTGVLRPNYTGQSVYSGAAGLHVNPNAFAPADGQWGNAGRNSITGPGQFALDASLSRTFRLTDRFSLDLRVDSTNALNHVNFPRWDTVVGSAQFGLPNTASPMRNVQTTLRVRF